MHRKFSRKTYNGFHLVSIEKEPVGFFNKLPEKDEFGNMISEQATCPYSGEYSCQIPHPWSVWLYIHNKCQQCPWIYRTPDNEFDCLLIAKTTPNRLINGRVD